MLHLPEVELKQTRFYQDVFAEGRTEGQQQEAAVLVLRQLRRRLGAVPAEVESQIRALPVAELEALGEALLDWRTPAELIAWLQRQG
jgi:predicted transposase YdaD